MKQIVSGRRTTFLCKSQTEDQCTFVYIYSSKHWN